MQVELFGAQALQSVVDLIFDGLGGKTKLLGNLLGRQLLVPAEKEDLAHGRRQLVDLGHQPGLQLLKRQHVVNTFGSLLLIPQQLFPDTCVRRPAPDYVDEAVTQRRIQISSKRRMNNERMPAVPDIDKYIVYQVLGLLPVLKFADRNRIHRIPVPEIQFVESLTVVVGLQTVKQHYVRKLFQG